MGVKREGDGGFPVVYPQPRHDDRRKELTGLARVDEWGDWRQIIPPDPRFARLGDPHE